jgi:hypothetical protein
MAQYTVQTYQRDNPAPGTLIYVSIFQADGDEDAKLQTRARSLLAVRGDFANLLNSANVIIHTVEA